MINPLKPKDLYIGRTAPLISRRCILCIYSTNYVLNIFFNLFRRVYNPCFTCRYSTGYLQDLFHILNTLQTLRFFLFKMPFISLCYLVWFLYYSHFTYRVCYYSNVKFQRQRVNFTPRPIFIFTERPPSTLPHFTDLLECRHFSFMATPDDFKSHLFTI